MTRQHRSRARLRPLCAEVHPDDGLDPKEFFRPAGGRKAGNRKTLQLCGQVADTLHQALADSHDDVLRNLYVRQVTPGADAAQVIVIVAPITADAPLEPREVLARLAAASGRLRAEVASAITRRRAPKLVFQLAALPATGTPPWSHQSPDDEVQP
ncbi:MAG: hypothetical protein AB7U73_19300 [Pirellulales bacterium]